MRLSQAPLLLGLMPVFACQSPELKGVGEQMHMHFELLMRDDEPLSRAHGSCSLAYDDGDSSTFDEDVSTNQAFDIGHADGSPINADTLFEGTRVGDGILIATQTLTFTVGSSQVDSDSGMTVLDHTRLFCNYTGDLSDGRQPSSNFIVDPLESERTCIVNLASDPNDLRVGTGCNSSN